MTRGEGVARAVTRRHSMRPQVAFQTAHPPVPGQTQTESTGSASQTKNMDPWHFYTRVEPLIYKDMPPARECVAPRAAAYNTTAFDQLTPAQQTRVPNTRR